MSNNLHCTMTLPSLFSENAPYATLISNLNFSQLHHNYCWQPFCHGLTHPVFSFPISNKEFPVHDKRSCYSPLSAITSYPISYYFVYFSPLVTQFFLRDILICCLNTIFSCNKDDVIHKEER